MTSLKAALPLLCASFYVIGGTKSCGKGFDPLTHTDSQTTAVNSGDFPWFVSLQRRNENTGEFQHECSATLIACDWVITAARCVKDAVDDLGSLRLVAGSVMLGDDDANAQTLWPEAIFVHPDFVDKKPVAKFDYALIKLEAGFDLSKPNVDIICLPEKFKITSGKCFVTGLDTETKTCAQRTLIKQIRKKKCKKLWNNKLATELNLRKARSFCVSQDGGPFHAQDLGSPVQCVNDDDRYEIMGHLSLSPGGAYVDNVPSVYAKTSTVLDWIKSYVDPSIGCNVAPAATLPPTTARPSDCEDPNSGKSNDFSGLFFGVRVIGGTDADAAEYPWQLALRIKGRRFPFCGASLISCRYVLTACHCLTRVNITNFEVVAGMTDVASTAEARQFGTPNRIIFHPRCNTTGQLIWDYAIIELKEKFELSHSVRTIRLPAPSDDFGGQSCKITGWGLNDNSLATAVQPEKLQEADVTVQTQEECKADIESKTPAKFDPTIICVKDKQACFGDSGGPVQCKVGDRFVVAGSSSFTFSVTETLANGTTVRTICYEKLPVGYANISVAVDWIREVTGIYH